MTRTSRGFGAFGFFGSRLVMTVFSLIPRKWDGRRLHRLERCAEKTVTVAGLKLCARDAGGEL
jgi:hypothetical protein